MFGMMFGDVGHGLMVVALALGLRSARSGRLLPYRHLWPLPAAAGAMAAAFGLLYGEALGPTGLVPALWMDPLDDPVRLLVVAIGLGAILLSASYAIGALNRAREDGFVASLLAPSGIAGFLLLLGGAIALLGWYRHIALVLDAGLGLAVVAAGLQAVGFMRAAGHGGVAVAETIVEVFDTVLRTAGNTVSFARLAAFGLVHAAIGQAVVDGVTTLRGSPLGWAAAIAAVRDRQCRRAHPRGARGGRPGPAPRVLRTVLADLRRRGPSLPTMEVPRDRRPLLEADMIASLRHRIPDRDHRRGLRPVSRPALAAPGPAPSRRRQRRRRDDGADRARRRRRSASSTPPAPRRRAGSPPPTRAPLSSAPRSPLRAPASAQPSPSPTRARPPSQRSARSPSCSDVRS